MDELEAKEHRQRAEALISTAEFNSLLQEETKRLEAFLPTLNGEQLRPMLFAILAKKDQEGNRQQALIALTAMPSGEEKQKVLFAAGRQAAKAGLPIAAALLISEAWAKSLSLTEGWRAKKVGMLPPSVCPDRQEALVVWGRTLDGRAGMAMAVLNRESKSAVHLEPWKAMPCPRRGKAPSVQDNLLGFFFAGYLEALSERIAGKKQ